MCQIQTQLRPPHAALLALHQAQGPVRLCERALDGAAGGSRAGGWRVTEASRGIQHFDRLQIRVSRSFRFVPADETSPGTRSASHPQLYVRLRPASSIKAWLINSVLHKIAFQYYPLDLSATSNPFLISWWPLALGDPALFHVSLQTACLDEELLAQKGFQTSELLMADSVALLRRKVEDTSLAVQDGTINSVITLATIEVRSSLELPLSPFLLSSGTHH